MGFFTWGGVDVIWKFDYYDATLKSAIDPMSPECKRIITVMLAKEY
jgi:hypothetical protein